MKFVLLYRGSTDGFTAQQFYAKLSKKGPSLHLIKSEHNRVFGGYTTVVYPGTGTW